MVTTEENVVADEVGSSSEVRPLGDEHFFDERETVDDDTRRRAQCNAEDVAVDVGQGGECFEGNLVLGDEVKAADDGPSDRPRWRTFGHGNSGRVGSFRLGRCGCFAAVVVFVGVVVVVESGVWTGRFVQFGSDVVVVGRNGSAASGTTARRLAQRSRQERQD